MIVEYGDVESLKNEIITSLEDKELTKKQVLNAQRYIKNNLDWKNVSDRILDIYSEAIRGSE